MVEVIFDFQFKQQFKKIKDQTTKNKIIKQVSKLKNNPTIGKPMKYHRKGTREVYISPYRPAYSIEKNIIYVLLLYHKNEQ